MTHIVLTGAGFSRNWGGMLASDVFTYLLGCNELDEELRRLLWRDRSFEDVLAALQFARMMTASAVTTCSPLPLSGCSTAWVRRSCDASSSSEIHPPRATRSRASLCGSTRYSRSTRTRFLSRSTSRSSALRNG